MSAVFLPLALVAYVVGIVLATLDTFHRSTVAHVGASIVFIVAWLAHLGAIVHRGMVLGRVPLANLAEYLLLLGALVMGLQLVIWFRWRIRVAGALLVTLVTAMVLTAGVLLDPAATPHPVSDSGWFLFHTSVSTLGMAALIVALVMSALYVVQDRALKSRRKLRILQRLPTLDRCDQIALQSLVLGFSLLTIGIATGFVINGILHHRLWILGAKLLFPVLAWAVFASVLGARILLGFRGRKSAYLTITGVTLGLLTVLGMTL